jgi:8-oxo-dGTP diphosphatase
MRGRSMRQILKIGVAITHAGKLLVVKKKGSPSYILPGGKPEPGEDDRHALIREIDEELGCTLADESIVFLGAFTDSAADLVDTSVTVRLYAAELQGKPMPQAEIERVEWFSLGDREDFLAPSLQNHIIPFLRQHGRVARTDASI